LQTQQQRLRVLRSVLWQLINAPHDTTPELLQAVVAFFGLVPGDPFPVGSPDNQRFRALFGPFLSLPGAPSGTASPDNSQGGSDGAWIYLALAGLFVVVFLIKQCVDNGQATPSTVGYHQVAAEQSESND
jgi:hypothetical protein